MPRSIAALIATVTMSGLTASSSDASSGKVFLNVQGYGAQPVVRYRPSELNRITGDGTAFVSHIQWRGWNSPQSYANGVALTDDCVPDCAEGKFTSHATHLHAYRIRFCPRAHRNVYTRLTLSGLHIGGADVLVINHDCVADAG